MTNAHPRAACRAAYYSNVEDVFLGAVGKEQSESLAVEMQRGRHEAPRLGVLFKQGERFREVCTLLQNSTRVAERGHGDCFACVQ